jgi:hypothetical protein
LKKVIYGNNERVGVLGYSTGQVIHYLSLIEGSVQQSEIERVKAVKIMFPVIEEADGVIVSFIAV